MGRSRGKRSKAKRHGALKQHQRKTAARVELDPFIRVESEDSELNLDGNQEESEVHEIENKEEEEEHPQLQEEVASAPEPEPNQEAAMPEPELVNSTVSIIHMEEPRIVPLMVGNQEFKIAMSRVQLEPDNFIWAVKLILDDHDHECRCQFHQQMRQANDVTPEN